MVLLMTKIQASSPANTQAGLSKPATQFILRAALPVLCLFRAVL